ncbi:hypothetical protein A2Y27_03585 [candidate division CPR2 bacterium GWD1_39_7]|nr:MAG: hypothetical protein A2Y27_03585 [candidate division CPR2 bacterium GWD1_39_7]
MERAVDATPQRRENSAEHSWSVALNCWLLRNELEQEFDTQLDLEKIFKMALMHDLVEIKSGDISAWDHAGRLNKKELEDKAAQEIFSDLPTMLRKELSLLWEEYEKHESLESKITQGLDRLSGTLQRLVSNQGWSDVKANIESLDEMQLPRIGFSKTLTKLYAKLKKEALDKELIN